MNKRMLIGKSYLLQADGRTRLCADINIDNKMRTYYFEVEKKYEDYFCVDRADPFLLALMYYAQTLGYDIECEQPVSERLLYQLKTYYLPSIYKARSRYLKSIDIEAKYIKEPLENEGRVGAPVSGGVDSFYAIARHLKETEGFRLDTLFITDYFNQFISEEDYRRRFNGLVNFARQIADELKMELVTVYTNMYDFRHPHWVDMHAFRYASCIMALGRLFGTYLYSSAYEFLNCNMQSDSNDTAHYDLFNTKILDTDTIRFYSSGGEVTRTDKIEYIAANKVAQTFLYVCNYEDHNCGVCDKCMRTQFNLFSTNNLDKFGSVFDLSMFEKNKYKYWIKMRRRRNEYDCETLIKMKENGIRTPFIVYIASLAGKPINLVKKMVDRNRFFHWLYYDTVLYRLYNGKRTYEVTKGNK